MKELDQERVTVTELKRELASTGADLEAVQARIDRIAAARDAAVEAAQAVEEELVTTKREAAVARREAASVVDELRSLRSGALMASHMSTMSAWSGMGPHDGDTDRAGGLPELTPGRGEAAPPPAAAHVPAPGSVGVDTGALSDAHERIAVLEGRLRASQGRVAELEQQVGVHARELCVLWCMRT